MQLMIWVKAMIQTMTLQGRFWHLAAGAHAALQARLRFAWSHAGALLIKHSCSQADAFQLCGFKRLPMLSCFCEVSSTERECMITPVDCTTQQLVRRLRGVRGGVRLWGCAWVCL